MTWEYIAGFVDGEGSIVKRKLAYNLYISQTDFEVLEKIRRFTGVGVIYEVDQRRPNWKQAWLYNAGGLYGTYHVLSHIIDHLIVKRDWAIYVLGELKTRIAEINQQKALKLERIERAIHLRSQGWTYRQIAKELKTDHGYVRRLVLSKK